MQIALIHLSDIHLRGDGANPIFRRTGIAERLGAAVRARLAGVEVAACFFVVTGDISYKGVKKEFDDARQLLTQIVAASRSELPLGVPVALIVIPGNHDCDFTGEYEASALRETLLTTDRLASLDDYSIGLMTAIQAPFRDFDESLPREPIGKTTVLNSCLTLRDFQFASQIIRFYCLNTAWMSRRKELQGALVFPVETFRRVTGEDKPALSIALLHHPRNWFTDSNGRELTRQLEAVCDVIMTGHEHDSDDAQVARQSGSQANYIEGWALQTTDARGSPSSSFKVVIVDTDAGSQTTFDLVLMPNGRYEPAIELPVPRALIRNPKRLEEGFPWNERGRAFVDDPGIPLRTDRKGRLTLSDLFVYPVLRETMRVGEPNVTAARMDGQQLEWSSMRVLITGGSLAGKTTLAKKLYADGRLLHDLVPVYMSGAELKQNQPEALQRAVEHAYSRDYEGPVERYRQLSRARKLIIVDDLHRSSQRAQGLDAIVRWLQRQFDHIVLLADNILVLDEIGSQDDRALLIFPRYEIMPFGHVKRDELVGRWCGIGRTQDEADELRKRAAKLTQQVDAIMGRRFVEHVPFFVLGILQQLEANEGVDNYTASQGAVFEALMTLRLESVFKADLVTAQNYLAHFAYELYQRRRRFLTAAEFGHWHDGYCRHFKHKLNQEDMLRMLTDAQVLQTFGDEFGFRYRYGYYLCVADYLTRRMEDETTREHVAGLFRSVFHEETANILIFLCFKARGHTEFVVNAMLKTAKTIFANSPAARLEEDAAALGKQLQATPTPRIEHIDPARRRGDSLAQADAEAGSEPYGDMKQDDLEMELQQESEYPPELREVHSAVRTIQIVGQVLRNFHGMLDGNRKVEISRAAYELSVRVIGWYFEFVKQHRDPIAQSVAELIALARPRVAEDDVKLGLRVQRVIAGFTELVATGMIRRASVATGMRALEEIHVETLEPQDGVEPTAAYRLIRASLQLDLAREAPVRQIERFAKEFRDNPYALRILQHLVQIYLCVNYVDAQTTQKLCSVLKIQVPLAAADRTTKLLPRAK